MDFETGEKTTAQVIRAIIGLKETNITNLANAMGTSRQNLTSKLKRNNFNESELRRIADILGYDLVLHFRERKSESEDKSGGSTSTRL